MKSTSKCPFIKGALFKIYLPQNDALSWIVNALPISHHQMPFNALSYWIFVWYDCEGHALSNNPRLFHRACPSCFSTMPFKCPSMSFQIAFLYDIILKGMPFQMPFQINVNYLKGHLKGHALQYHIIQKVNFKGHWRAFEGHCAKTRR